MIKVRMLACAAAIVAAASSAQAQVLKFDDIVGATTSGTGITIGSYYNGGGGPAFNFGIDFVGNAIAFCLNRPTLTSCSNTSWGSGADAVAADGRGTRGAGMTWLSSNPIMNRASGFTTGFSFFYSNPFAQNVGFTVWSGLNGTGTLLATWTSSPTLNGSSITGCFGANYCPFVAGGIGFSGTAQSVVFSGAANQFVYDDFTFGSVDPGVNPSVVPEPSTYALMATGLIGLVGLRRRNKNR